MGVIDISSGLSNLAGAVSGVGQTIGQIGAIKHKEALVESEKQKHYKFQAIAQKATLDFDAFSQDQMVEFQNNWASPDFDREDAVENFNDAMKDYYDENIRPQFDEDEAAQYESSVLYPMLSQQQTTIKQTIAGFDKNTGDTANLSIVSDTTELIGRGADSIRTLNIGLSAIDSLRTSGYYRTDEEAEQAKESLTRSSNLMSLQRDLFDLIDNSSITVEQSRKLIDAIISGDASIAGEYTEQAQLMMDNLIAEEGLDLFSFGVADQLTSLAISRASARENKEEAAIAKEVEEIQTELIRLNTISPISVEQVNTAFWGREDKYSIRENAVWMEEAKINDDNRMLDQVEKLMSFVNDGTLTIEDFEDDARWELFHNKDMGKKIKTDFVEVAKNNFDIEIEKVLLERYAGQDIFGKGNINLFTRPQVKDEEGKISTIRSISFEEDGVEILIPTVVNGKIVTNEEAIAHYKATGEYLGKFDTPEEATAYAESLHESQERMISGEFFDEDSKELLAKMYNQEAAEAIEKGIKDGYATQIKEYLDTQVHNRQQSTYLAIERKLMLQNQSKEEDSRLIRAAFLRGDLTAEMRDDLTVVGNKYKNSAVYFEELDRIDDHCLFLANDDESLANGYKIIMRAAFKADLDRNPDQDTDDYIREVADSMLSKDALVLDFINYKYGDGSERYWTPGKSDSGRDDFDRLIWTMSTISDHNAPEYMSTAYDMARIGASEQLAREFGKQQYEFLADDHGPVFKLNDSTSIPEIADILRQEFPDADPTKTPVILQYGIIEGSENYETALYVGFQVQKTDNEGNAIGSPSTYWYEYKKSPVHEPDIDVNIIRGRNLAAAAQRGRGTFMGTDYPIVIPTGDMYSEAANEGYDIYMGNAPGTTRLSDTKLTPREETLTRTIVNATKNSQGKKPLLSNPLFIGSNITQAELDKLYKLLKE